MGPWTAVFESLTPAPTIAAVLPPRALHARPAVRGTVIQHIYDCTSRVARVEEMVRQWAGLSRAVEAGVLDDDAL
jgi:hypothetical protein